MPFWSSSQTPKTRTCETCKGAGDASVRCTACTNGWRWDGRNWITCYTCHGRAVTCGLCPRCHGIGKVGAGRVSAHTGRAIWWRKKTKTTVTMMMMMDVLQKSKKQVIECDDAECGGWPLSKLDESCFLDDTRPICNTYLPWEIDWRCYDFTLMRMERLHRLTLMKWHQTF